MLPPGTRFACTRIWTIDINEYGSNYCDMYHVVSSTPKSMLLLSTSLFEGDVHVDGNQQLDKILDAYANGKEVLNETTTPSRYMLKKNDRGDFFVVGKGTASRHVYLNGTSSVTYIARGIEDKGEAAKPKAKQPVKAKQPAKAKQPPAKSKQMAKAKQRAKAKQPESRLRLPVQNLALSIMMLGKELRSIKKRLGSKHITKVLASFA